MSLKKKSKSKSIRVRLFWGYAGFLLLSILTVAVYFYIQMNRNMVEISKKYLREEFDTIIQLVQAKSFNQSAIINYLSEHSASRIGFHKINYALFDEEGFVIARSKDYTEDRQSVNRIKTFSNQGIYEKTIKNSINRRVLLGTKVFCNHYGNVFYLQLGVDPLSGQETLKIVIKTFFMVTPVVFLVVAFGTFLFTGRVLAPISKLAVAAKMLSLKDESRNLPMTGTGDELDQLASSFNDVHKRLRASYQKIVNFTADASHELRLPLTAIKGEAEVVLERARGIEEYQSTLRSIIEEHDKLIRMLNKLMILARGDSGKIQQEFCRLDLVALIGNLTDFYKPLAESNNLSLNFSSKEREAYITGDMINIQQLFSNLIENAIKYNTINGKIEIKLNKSGNKYLADISDTGIGISSEDKRKIFERFYRVDKSRSRSEGSAGLGLSIVEMIINEHRGKITVESEFGKGSCFTITFPTS